MKLYYQNETLFIEMNMDLDDLNYFQVRRRLFHIIGEYDINRVVLVANRKYHQSEHILKRFQTEYYHNFKGLFLLK